MDNGIIQQSEWMGAAPPAGSIGRIAAVGCPGITFIFIQLIENTHILRKSDGLKGSHIFTAGEHISSGHFRIDLHDGSNDKFFFI